MDRYICDYCKTVLDGDELKSERSWLTDTDYEFRLVCPICGRDELVEAEACKGCGEYFEIDELEGGYCKECADKIIDSFNYDPVGIYNITDCIDDTDVIEINSFLASTFSTDEIEEILLKELTSVDKNYGWYTNGDREWFLEAYDEYKEKNGGDNR